MEMTIWQRTTTLPQFLLRLCGVIGGVWVCAGWAVKIGAKAATAVGVVGEDEDGAIVNEMENAALRKKASQRWGAGDLRARSGNGWTIDGGSPVASGYSPYAASPVNGYAAGANGSAASTPIRTGSYGFQGPSPPNVSAPGSAPAPQGSYQHTNGRPQQGRHVSTGSGNEPLSSSSPVPGDSSPYAPSPSSSIPAYANGHGAATLRPKGGPVLGADKRID